MTYLLYQHSQYAAFDRPDKTELMVITLGKSVTMGDLKISKTDVKPGFSIKLITTTTTTNFESKQSG